MEFAVLSIRRKAIVGSLIHYKEMACVPSTTQFLSTIVYLLNELSRHACRSEQHHRFESISIRTYAERIRKYLKVSTETLILTAIYIDRLLARKRLFLDTTNIHLVFLVCVVIAKKFHCDDNAFNNRHSARVGGIGLKELNKHERSILIRLNYELYVDESLYIEYRRILCDFMTPIVEQKR